VVSTESLSCFRVWGTELDTRSPDKRPFRPGRGLFLAPVFRCFGQTSHVFPSEVRVTHRGLDVGMAHRLPHRGRASSFRQTGGDPTVPEIGLPEGSGTPRVSTGNLEALSEGLHSLSGSRFSSLAWVVKNRRACALVRVGSRKTRKTRSGWNGGPKGPGRICVSARPLRRQRSEIRRPRRSSGLRWGAGTCLRPGSPEPIFNLIT
jgi:hypothetical protein